MKLIISLLLLLSCGDTVLIKVSWAEVIGQGVQYYTVYRDNASKYKTTKNYIYITLPPEKYCFQVSATNIVGESSKSDVVCITKER